MWLLQRWWQAALAINGVAAYGVAYGPTPKDWPVPGAWPSVFYGLIPIAVADFCGGIVGKASWNDVSEPCATWAVRNVKCQQACRQTSRLSGFGACMKACAGAPSPSWCSLPGAATQSVKKHCLLFTRRWATCKIVTTAWASEEDWFREVDRCVFDCETALETEEDLGQALGWRRRKCLGRWFALTSPDGCREVEAKQCMPPVGDGALACHLDSLTCGSKNASSAFLSLPLRSEPEPPLPAAALPPRRWRRLLR